MTSINNFIVSEAVKDAANVSPLGRLQCQGAAGTGYGDNALGENLGKGSLHTKESVLP